MNEKVEALISKRKEELRKRSLKRRNQHLVDLGLVSEKSTRQYFDTWQNTPDCKWDEEKKKYYIGVEVPLEVTDEEYAEICKYFPETTSMVEIETFGAEVTLKTIASIILVVGILSFLILVGMAITGEFPPVVVVYAIVVLIIGLSFWAAFRCFANISISLKKINSKIK